MHTRSFAAIAFVTLGLGGSGCATGGKAPAGEAVGETEQAIVNGWDDEATPAANATVKVDGGCSGTLVRPDMVLTAAHCLGNIGQSPSCALPQPGAAQWQRPGIWYPFSCREPVNVLLGNDGVGLWADGPSLAAEEMLKLRDLGGSAFASGNAVSLQSSGGYFLAVEGDRNAWVGVDQVAAGPGGRFVVERESGPGPIRSGQTVYLRFEDRYVTVSRSGLLEVKATSRTSTGRFMIGRAGGAGVVEDRDIVGLLSSNGRWVRAAHGGGAWVHREVATAYNVPWGSDLALLRLRSPVPDAVAKPRDLVHRIPANRLDPSRKWSDSFCNGSEVCRTGDFNGDGRDDIMALNHGAAGDVYIGISGKDRPFAGTRWNTGLCTGSQECQTGDFNGDGKDDLVVFLKNTEPGAAENDVQVRLSTGASFGAASLWHEDLCGIGQSCAVGDFDGDGKSDLISWTRTAGAGASVGDVRVALNEGGAFGLPKKWQGSLCAGNEICKVGDFNGDGRSDMAVFLRDTRTDSSRGDVLVSLSTGSGFGAAQLWHDGFCLGGEVCEVGDFDGDGKDDIVTFVRNARTDGGSGNVQVAVSNGESFGGGRVWTDSLCLANEVCKTGDFNGDGRADAIAFTRNSSPGAEAGDVRVSLAAAPGSLEEFLSGEQLSITGWGDVVGAEGTLERPKLRQAGRVELDERGGAYDGINAARMRPVGDAAPAAGDAGSPLSWWDPDQRRFLTLGANQSVDEASSADYTLAFGPGGWDVKHDGSYRSNLGLWVRTALAIEK